MVRAAPAALLVSLAACGAPEVDEPPEAEAPAAPDGAALKHEEDIGSAAAGIQVRVRNCAYVTTTSPVGLPPRYDLVLSRIASPGCPAQSKVIDSSYATTTVLTAVKGGQGIALAYSYKATPSGSALTHVHVFAVDPETLDVTRTAFLGIPTGNTSAEALFFKAQNLVVKGTEKVITPPATEHFTAVFPHFLTSGTPPTLIESP
jgi:hypothetical protein